MSSIFFTVSRDNPDGEPTVVAMIYSPEGLKMAEHVMTIEGARIRMHDLEAVITQADKIRNTPRYRIHTSDGHEFGTDYTLAEARRIKAEYAAEFPTIRYRIRKAPRRP